VVKTMDESVVRRIQENVDEYVERAADYMAAEIAKP
jgi:hypothetical protein